MTDARDQNPTRVGPYRLEGHLGAGGMGQVYRAFDERLERRVALKQILPDSASDARIRQRFLREARAAAKLNHPAIVQIHDILEVDGCDWIVMELVDGDTLDDLVARGPLPPERVVELAGELAGGLAAAHDEGIVHRDLKAKNVLVSSRGRIKILDFGLAKPIEAQEADVSISIVGQVVGTPRAMSPEQATGGEVDHRSDLFSLGTLLYEMATGVSPFTAGNVMATVTRVCTHRQEPACEVQPAVPVAVSELIDRLLEKEPAHRPQTAREVVRELRDFSDTTAVSAPSPAVSDAETVDASGKLSPAPGRQRTTVERRQITVMSCELALADESAAGLDPETLVEVVPDFHALVSEAIAEFDGHLGSGLGHRLVVYFGYPRAHEDDARRAVKAALQILAEIEPLNDRAYSEAPGRLALRIGIHTGLAVVMPDSGGHEQVALGQTLEVATRVESLAALGTVVVSPSTHPLIEGFFVEEAMPPVALPGFGSPVPIHRVVAAHDIHTRVELAQPMLPLIGRQQELDLLLSRWQLSRGGDGQVVLLSGEAGIGKSRLVYTLEKRLLEDGAQWLMCYGSPYAQSSPLRPLIELLRRVLEVGDGARQLQRLEHSIHQRGFEPAEFVPLFAPLLGLELDERYPPPAISPEKQRSETMEAILTLLMAMADEQPLVLVVEDLHWVDPSTLEILGLLIDQVPATPLLLVLTFRNEFEAPWGHHAYLLQLNLNRLVGEEMESLIARVPGGKDLPDDIRQQIVDKTDGVPLFVEELTKTVLESGLLDDRAAASGSSSTLPSLDIPATLRDSLTARLDRLGAAKEVAQVASVIGRGFRYDLLAAVSDLEDAVLEQELGRLVEAELVMRRGFGSRLQYVFKHALIQDAAYDSLLKRTQQQYHERIAGALEDRFPETATTQPELLAHHYTAARSFERAIDYWLRAGHQTYHRSAFAEATDHLHKGLELVPYLPESTDRARRELELQAAVGAVASNTKGYAAPEVDKAYGRALEISQEVDDAPELFWILWGLARFHLFRGNVEQALEIGHRLVRLAELQEDHVVGIAAHSVLGGVLFHRGEFATAVDCLEQGIALDSLDRDRPYAAQTGEDLGVVSLGWAAVSLWFLGYPEQARKRCEDALALAQGISHPISETYARGFAGFLGFFLRDWPGVLESFQKVLVESREQGTWWESFAQMYIGWARIMGGGADGTDDPSDELIERIRGGFELYFATGARSNLMMYALFAEAAIQQRQGKLARTLLEKARAEVEATGERFFEAEIHRLRGELELIDAREDLQGARTKRAQEAFEQALEVARRQQARCLELRATSSLSRLWARQGKKADAHELLASICGWFTEGLDTEDLKTARNLLDELAS